MTSWAGVLPNTIRMLADLLVPASWASQLPEDISSGAASPDFSPWLIEGIKALILGSEFVLPGPFPLQGERSNNAEPKEEGKGGDLSSFPLLSTILSCKRDARHPFHS